MLVASVWISLRLIKVSLFVICNTVAYISTYMMQVIYRMAELLANAISCNPVTHADPFNAASLHRQQEPMGLLWTAADCDVVEDFKPVAASLCSRLSLDYLAAFRQRLLYMRR